MKLIKSKNAAGIVKDYMLRLSAVETYNWAHRPNNSWPCSTIANHRLWVSVDTNGLYDYCLGGQGNNNNVDGVELAAIVADHLHKDCRHLWPCWEI